MQKENEIEVLFAGKEVVVNGEQIEIKPLSWSGTMKAVKPLAVILKEFIAHTEQIDVVLKRFTAAKNKDVESENEVGISNLDIVLAITQMAEVMDMDRLTNAVETLLHIATNKPREHIKSLMIDDMITLCMAVYEVNKSFFTKRLAGMEMPSGKTN